ncbi:hypothetical protein HK101_002334, partial [Irineochytrium annulatum]
MPEEPKSPMDVDDLETNLSRGTRTSISNGYYRPSTLTRSRRPGSVRSRAFTLKSSLPPGVRTTLHVPRLLFFVSIFVVPYALGLIPLINRTVFSAVGVRDYRIGLLTATQDYFFGFFDMCTSPTPGTAAPDQTIPGAISTSQVCQTYHQICSTIRFQENYDGGPFIDPEFCGPRWKAAVALQIISAICGTVVILILIDNSLVWLNRSCWYHPKRHLQSEVDCVRRLFKALIILGVLSHGASQAGSMAILLDLQRSRIRWPTGLDFQFGILVQGVSWVADVAFVILFLFFDRLTFFVNVDFTDAPEGAEEEWNTGSLRRRASSLRMRGPSRSGSFMGMGRSGSVLGFGSATMGSEVGSGGMASPALKPKKKKKGKKKKKAQEMEEMDSAAFEGGEGAFAFVGGSRIDAVAIQVIKGEAPPAALGDDA